MSEESSRARGLPVDDLVTVACPSCGGRDDERLAVRSDGLPTVRCRACGLAFLNPRPSDAAFARLYANYLYDAASPSAYVDYDRVEAQRLSGEDDFFHKVLDTLDQFRPDCLNGSCLLDIGCASGGLLELARRRGSRVRGVELDPIAAETGRRRWGLEVFSGTVEACTWPDASCDLVTSLDVIEHVLDLPAFVDAVHRLLAPGGLWTITTPNFGLFHAAPAGYHGLRMCFEHVLYFERATLTELLRRHGFRVRYATCLYPQAFVVRTVDQSRQRPGRLVRLYRRLKQVPGLQPLVWAALHAFGRLHDGVRDEVEAGTMLFVVAEKLSTSAAQAA